MKKWLRRPKEESPIYTRRLTEALASARQAVTDEEERNAEEAMAAARAYGERVDEFNRTGIVVLDFLPAVLPDEGRTMRIEGMYQARNKLPSGELPATEGHPSLSPTPRAWLRDPDSRRALTNT